MFDVIMTWLSTNVGGVFDFIGSLLTGPVGLIYTTTPTPALTETGELVLMGALIGLAFFGLKWVLSLIPFAKSK